MAAHLTADPVLSTRTATGAAHTISLTPPAAAALVRTTESPWYLDELWAGIRWAGATLWHGCGLHWQGTELWVTPAWPTTWPWWALMDLPFIDDRTLTLLWDGTTLHTTQPIHTTLPTQEWKTIRTRRTDELDFDLYFELQTEVNGEMEVLLFHPSFHNE
ncbi:MAG: hypothetical protein R2867_14165 [Caldilineaceae bacterium]